MRSQLWQYMSRGHAPHSHTADLIKRADDFHVVLVFALLGLALSLLAVSQGGWIGYDQIAEVFNVS
jgi:uncharacterized membrane protein YoaT (DUF817 family)